MTVNWEVFTPEMSFLGGKLIGLAALILMFVNGRVMGVRGILVNAAGYLILFRG